MFGSVTAGAIRDARGELIKNWNKEGPCADISERLDVDCIMASGSRYSYDVWM